MKEAVQLDHCPYSPTILKNSLNHIFWKFFFNCISVISRQQLTLFMSSWVSPVLGSGSEMSCPRTLLRKNPEDPVRLEHRTPWLQVKHFTTEPRRTPSRTRTRMFFENGWWTHSKDKNKIKGLKVLKVALMERPWYFGTNRWSSPLYMTILLLCNWDSFGKLSWKKEKLIFFYSRFSSNLTKI